MSTDVDRDATEAAVRAAARAHCLSRYRYDPSAFVSAEAYKQHVADDVDSTAQETEFRATIAAALEAARAVYEQAQQAEADERAVADALCRVELALAAKPYRTVGGLAEVERSELFDAVNQVARDLFGDRWVTVMRDATGVTDDHESRARRNALKANADVAAAEARTAVILAEAKRLKAEVAQLELELHRVLAGGPEHAGGRIVAHTLRKAAEGRREYAKSLRADMPDHAEMLVLQADTLDQAADIAEGDIRPLYSWLPSWRWTDEMTRALGDSPLAAEVKRRGQ
ncbi:MAG: hypothetical protein PHQ28_03370 [Mycobacterium sp.]|nr:hypothetical protein [Mycobacterium sp.]